MPITYQVPVITRPRRRRVQTSNHFPFKVLRAVLTDGTSGTVTAFSESAWLPAFPSTLLRSEDDEFVSERVAAGLFRKP
jgi:hypothetical protein